MLGDRANQFFIYVLCWFQLFQWGFGEFGHQIREDLSFYGDTRHVLDVKSPKNCTLFGYPSCVIGTSKYGFKRELSKNDDCMCLEVMRQLTCAKHYCQDSFLQWQIMQLRFMQ